MKINKKLLLALCTAASLLAGIPAQGIITSMTVYEHAKSPYENPLIVCIGEYHMQQGQESLEAVSFANTSKGFEKLYNNPHVSWIIECSEERAAFAYERVNSTKQFHPILTMLSSFAHMDLTSDSCKLAANFIPAEWRTNKILDTIINFYYYQLPNQLDIFRKTIGYLLGTMNTSESRALLKEIATVDPYELPMLLITPEYLTRLKKINICTKTLYNIFNKQLRTYITSIDVSYKQLTEAIEQTKNQILGINQSNRRKKLANDTALQMDAVVKEILDLFPPGNDLNKGVIQTIVDLTLEKDQNYKNLNYEHLTTNVVWYKTLIAHLADFGFIAEIKMHTRPIIIVYAGAAHTRSVGNYFSATEDEGYQAIYQAKTTQGDTAEPISDPKPYNDFFEKIEKFEKDYLAHKEKKQQETQSSLNKKPVKRKLFDDKEEDPLKQKLKKLK